jgi:uncharacterized protein (DUF433 family)
MQMGGAPCIRGLRIPVATVIGMVADGMSHREILGAYPDLEADIREALHFAAESPRERELPLLARHEIPGGQRPLASARGRPAPSGA